MPPRQAAKTAACRGYAFLRNRKAPMKGELSAQLTEGFWLGFRRALQKVN